MWSAFVNWFTQAINGMYHFTEIIGWPNYGLAIILISIVIKIVLFPLTQRQMKSMREMQAIQPRMKYIQSQYKEDPQLMQRKLAELYKEHNVNPFGGCLPLLIQMPILFAFYQSLFKLSKTAFIHNAHANFLWIPNIGQPDPYYILAILVAATTFYQQKISMADSNDPTQKTMLYMMPLFIGFISYKMAAGLPLYWVTFNLLSIAQQIYVNRTAKPLVVAGTGNTIETQEMEAPEPPEEKTESGEKEVAGRDKGGTSQDGGPNRRKKRKKH